MSSNFGDIINIQIFGQSHSNGLGVVIDGLPSGEAIDLDQVDVFLKRRQGGKKHSTPRKEADTAEILSGLVNGATCGAPLAAIFKNSNINPSAYNELWDTPRPSHADLTARQRYRNPDPTGGGHFSGRLTLPLCFAGAVALQLLARKGIMVAAHISDCGGLQDKRFDPNLVDAKLLNSLTSKPFPTIDDSKAEGMGHIIQSAHNEGDSVGGAVECAVIGLPAGIGNPMFDGVESALAKVLFGVPAVRGVEFGAGFSACSMKGSEHNDAYELIDGNPVPKTNNAGGVLGGITTGAPLIFRVGFKPTASISKGQVTLNMKTGKQEALSIRGRHDPFIALRAVPVVEAAAAVVILDLLLASKGEL